MGARTDQAVCIRHWDFSDTSQTVSMLTRQSGIVRGIAKGARRERGPHSGGFDLITQGELCWIESSTSELATLTAWSPTESWQALRTTTQGNHAAWYAIECVGRLLQPHDHHPHVFDALVAALHEFSGATIDAAMCRFLWTVLRETGFQPNVIPTDSTVCAFDPDTGCVPTGTLGAWSVRVSTLNAIRAAVEGQITPAQDDAHRGATLLAACVRHHLQHEPASQAAYFGPIPQGRTPPPHHPHR